MSKSQYVPFMEFARILNPARKSRRCFVLLTFYADESFNGRSFCLGGWLANGEVWASIGNQWEKRIAYEQRKHPKLRRYHATDCNGGYRDYKDWSKPQRDQHTKKLLRIITRKADRIRAVCFGMDLNGLNRHFPDPKDDLTGAYNVALRKIMGMIYKAVKHDPEYRVAIIHSDAPGYNGVIRDAFDKLMNDPAFPHYRKVFTTLAPLRWEDCIQLQPADMIAFEGFKVIDSEVNSTTPKLRKSLQAILGEDVEVDVRYFSEANFAELARKHKARVIGV